MRPRHIRIMGVDWEVAYLKPNKWPTDHKDSCGITHAHTQEILILNKGSEATIRDTLLHEILHAALSSAGTSHAMTLVPSEHREEIIVAGLTPVLLDILRDNHGLTKYLVGL